MRNFSFIERLRNKIRIDHHNHIALSNSIKITHSKVRIKGKNNTLNIDEGARIRGAILEITGNNCSILIGKECMIGDGCYLQVQEDGIHLQIDDDCGLSRNVKVMASDGHPIYQEGKRINPAKDILIQKHVWVADSVTILKGVSIGEGCVIGINSLVTRSIPKHSIAVGVPAKVVTSNINWEDKFQSKE